MATKKTTAKKTAPKASQGFAIIATGGKQYLVTEGATITVEKLTGAEEGKNVVFDKVLLADNGTTTEIGTPYLTGKKVEGKVVSVGRAKKVVVVKYKAKSRYFKNRGHRQPFTKVEITSL